METVARVLPHVPAAGDVQAEMEADLASLVRLVEGSRVAQARELARELARKWPDSPPIQHMARVLEPGRVVVGDRASGRGLDREYAWLRAHAHEYPGCWLAVFEDRLIAALPDRAAVVAEARAVLGGHRALLFYQPGRLE